MGIKYFNLVDGSLEFQEEKILIFDKARRNQISTLLVTIGGLIYSAATMIKGVRLKENGNLWFGLILTVIWVLILIFNRKRFQKIDNEIFLSEIDMVTFSSNKVDGSTIANIMTKKNLKRKIKIVPEDNQDIDFKNLLTAHHIKID